MCVVSMVSDHYRDKWMERPFGPFVVPAIPNWPGLTPSEPPAITKQEFDELKRDISEMKQLLKRARQYDIDNNEPHCESAEKVATLRRAAALVGETVEDVLPA